MASYGNDMDDDDDFEQPSTPRSIRSRNAMPPKPRLKRPTLVSSLPSSQQKQQQCKQSTLPLKRKLPLTENGQEQERSTLSSQPTATMATEHSAIKPRKGMSLSLRKPGIKKSAKISLNGTKEPTDPADLQQPMIVSESIQATEVDKPEELIVLDSESDGEHADMETTQHVGDLDLTTTQISGVNPLMSPFSRRVNTDLREQSPPIFEMKCTQESVASSQGSDDGYQDNNKQGSQAYVANNSPYSQTIVKGINITYSAEPHDAGSYGTHWSLSPDTTNPFLSDLVASPALPVASSTMDLQKHNCPAFNVFETTHSSTAGMDESFAGTLDIQSSGYIFDPDRDADGALECVICGKMLVHLDRARIEYHINTCIDEQQTEQQTLQSMNLDSQLQDVLSSEGIFAGAQVDYLTRVKRCPICKQPWPLKGKGKAGSVTQPKKARDKVEHMKRCAKAHNRTLQSLVYQIRLLKEQYERSLMLGTPMESDPIASQEMDGNEGNQNHDMSESSTEESLQKSAARKHRVNTIVRKQVVSLTETADIEFESDAIISTVHAPTPLRAPKLTKLQQLEQDQQDEGLQMALAISLSMQLSPAGSTSDLKADSPFDSSSFTTWSMVPQEKGIFKKKSKRRRQTERERNETTVLPYAEVQHLIQANVQALLFPDTDIKCPSPVINYQSDYEDKVPFQIRTPPWGPSRFSGVTKRDLEPSLSQSSEPDISSPTKSLWGLSHLKDTRDIESLDLGVSEYHDDTKARNQDEQRDDGNEPTMSFDREKYTSRFMKRFVRLNSQGLDNENNEKTRVSSVGPIASLSTLDSEEINSQNEPGSSERDNKFSSPLWSASKSRRISLKDHRKANRETFEMALKREITSHLEAMAEQIQQAKVTAYEKILESLMRHPVAAGLQTSEAHDIVIPEEESDFGLSNEASQELDAYQAPSSPLLRYSNIFGPTKSPSSIFHTTHSPEYSGATLDRSKHRDPMKESEHMEIEAFNQHFMDPEQDDNQLHQCDEEEQVQSAIMIYSPGDPLPNSTPTASQHSFTPARINSVDLGGAHSPNMSFHSIQSEEGSSFSLRRISLPPPLDFAKMGYDNAAFMSTPTQPLSIFDSLPESLSQTVLNEDDEPWHNSNLSTPKGDASKLTDGDAAKAPDRPRNDGPPLAPSPKPPQKQHLKNVLHGLPLLKSALPTVEPEGNNMDNDEGKDSDTMDFDEPTCSQKIALPLSQAASVNPARTTGRAADKQIPRTPSRSTSNQLSTSRGRKALHASISTATATTTARIVPPPSKTPSKRKNKPIAVQRAEKYAAESAKAVANLKAQRTMPDYKNMTVARLRLAATTFGLKAGSKQALVDQLTTIWEGLNSEQDEEGDQEQNENEDVNQDDRVGEYEAESDDEGLLDTNDSGKESDNRAKGDQSRNSSSSLLAEISSSQFSLGIGTCSFSEHDVSRLPDVAEGSTSQSRRKPRKILANLNLDEIPESPVVSEVEEEEVEEMSGNGDSGDEDDDTTSLTGVSSDDDNVQPTQHELADITTDLELQLFTFLKNAAHLSKQYLRYKPLDLEQ
ncbi:hypothetical protein BGX27_000960, partial [Mortierella sp. AM989]